MDADYYPPISRSVRPKRSKLTLARVSPVIVPTNEDLKELFCSLLTPHHEYLVLLREQRILHRVIVGYFASVSEDQKRLLVLRGISPTLCLDFIAPQMEALGPFFDSHPSALTIKPPTGSIVWTAASELSDIFLSQGPQHPGVRETMLKAQLFKSTLDCDYFHFVLTDISFLQNSTALCDIVRVPAQFREDYCQSESVALVNCSYGHLRLLLLGSEMKQLDQNFSQTKKVCRRFASQSASILSC